MIKPGQIISGEIVGGSNDTGLFDVSVGGSSPFLYVPTAHRKDQYFVGMDCVLGFINTDSPVIISRGFKRILPQLIMPVTSNAYPWQCHGRDAWNSNMSDYTFSWDTSNPFAWEQSCGDAKNAVIADVGGKDYIYFNSAGAAVCLDEDKNIIWSHTLPTITLPGSVYAGYGFLSEEKFYAVRIVFTDYASIMYTVYDVYSYITGDYIEQVVATAIPPNSAPYPAFGYTWLDKFIIKPTQNGEVQDGVDNHYFAAWLNKYLKDGTFTSVVGQNRNFPMNTMKWINIANHIVTERYNEDDIGRYLSSLNCDDMSLVGEIQLPYVDEDTESHIEQTQQIVAIKNEYGSYVYVLSGGGTATASVSSRVIDDTPCTVYTWTSEGYYNLYQYLRKRKFILDLCMNKAMKTEYILYAYYKINLHRFKKDSG